MQLSLIYIGAVIGIAAASVTGGWTVRGWQCDADKTDTLQVSIRKQQEQDKAYGELQQLSQDLAITLEQERLRGNNYYARLQTELEASKDKPDCKPTAEWMRIWNAANRGEQYPDTSTKPDPAMSRPADSRHDKHAGDDPKPHKGH